MKTSAILIFFLSIWNRFTLTLGALLENGSWTSHFAKMKMSGVGIVALIGKIGGTVFFKGRTGPVARTFVVPSNPDTSFQAAVRLKLAQLSSAYRNLSEIERAGWKAVVSQYAKTDTFGDLRNPTAQGLFVSLNSNILNAGGVQISTAPQAASVDSPVAGAYIANTVGPVHTVAFTPTPVSALHSLIVEGTEALSQGISNAKSKFRQIEVFAAASASPADIAASHAAKFGALIQNTKLFVRIRFIRTDTGQVSGRSIVSTTVL